MKDLFNYKHFVGYTNSYGLQLDLATRANEVLNDYLATCPKVVTKKCPFSDAGWFKDPLAFFHPTHTAILFGIEEIKECAHKAEERYSAPYIYQLYCEKCGVKLKHPTNWEAE